MVAPNGARRTTADHPAVPVTIPDIVESAVARHAAGAGAIHFHVRDTDQQHIRMLACTQALVALRQAVPDMHLPTDAAVASPNRRASSALTLPLISTKPAK